MNFNSPNLIENFINDVNYFYDVLTDFNIQKIAKYIYEMKQMDKYLNKKGLLERYFCSCADVSEIKRFEDDLRDQDKINALQPKIKQLLKARDIIEKEVIQAFIESASKEFLIYNSKTN